MTTEHDKPEVIHLDNFISIDRQQLNLHDIDPKYIHLKDGITVFDGEKWHLYVTADKLKEGGDYEIIHFISPDKTLSTDWVYTGKIDFDEEPSRISAPGVVYDPDTKLYTMFVHTNFRAEYGVVGTEHIDMFQSYDGVTFLSQEQILQAEIEHGEISIYDPHPFEYEGNKYIIYTAVREHRKHAFCLARSTDKTWQGTWEKLGPVLEEHEVPFQDLTENKETSIEGPQIIIVDNIPILFGVCFLEEGPATPPGKRQRVFIAIGQEDLTHFFPIGPLLSPVNNEWESGENGHPAAVLNEDVLSIIYHSRAKDPKVFDPPWRLGMGNIKIEDIKKLHQRMLSTYYNHQQWKT
ncbi:MAG TPA: hypothetical protein VK338_03015 [Candidatus Nitrosocosmicus sp.]|nr:hypothetical protein [Candidatus Nitrosocosmicus sp.]